MNDTSALESEIDRLVYHLYNLTEDEIKSLKNHKTINMTKLEKLYSIIGFAEDAHAQQNWNKFHSAFAKSHH